MKPASFDYYRPDTVDEALQLLDEAEDEGKILAGGQSLVPIMNMRLATPQCIIDVNGLNGLDTIRYESGLMKIGALSRQRCLEQNNLVKEKVPLIAEAAPFIGHTQTRNRGTIGGSLVHADPSAEIPLSLLVLDAQAVIRSCDEERTVPVSDFFVTYLTTDIMPNEMLTEIQIPTEGIPQGYAFVEFSRRHGDFALVDAACLIDTDEQRRITSVRLALGGVDAIPVLSEDATELLVGEKLSSRLLEEVGRAVQAEVDPDEDLHASREYRRHLAGVFAKRAVRLAYQRAIQGGGTG
ncbi:FAD binding domain-containing protein [Melghirimyces profundicolus]|uniref:FAD binding domain-containing protein n=1 Tax=Melghirimyces profundicolus TaxID=1242148 RepID=UPI000D3AE3A9|nr:xanthine dehydrogenase family protein subunit M [Melghirimyces profundicolus]